MAEVPVRTRSATRPGATGRPSGPAGCSRRRVTRWPPSSAAIPARSSSPRAAPSRPTWPSSGPPRRRRAGAGGPPWCCTPPSSTRRCASRAGPRRSGRRRRGASCPSTARGVVDADALAGRCPRTCTALVAVMLANNETGVVQPLADVVERGRERRAPRPCVFTDAVQAAAWLDLAEIAVGADLVSLSAHKVGGPVGRRRAGGPPAGGARRPPVRRGPGTGAAQRDPGRGRRGRAGRRAAAGGRRAGRGGARGWPRCATGCADGLAGRDAPGCTARCRPGVAVLPGHLPPVPRRASSARSCWWPLGERGRLRLGRVVVRQRGPRAEPRARRHGRARRAGARCRPLHPGLTTPPTPTSTAPWPWCPRWWPSLRRAALRPVAHWSHAGARGHVGRRRLRRWRRRCWSSRVTTSSGRRSSCGAARRTRAAARWPTSMTPAGWPSSWASSTTSST